MDRRGFGKSIVALGFTGFSGCGGDVTKDLRVRNLTETNHTINVVIRNGDTVVLEDEFNPPANSHEGVVVDDVYPGAGTYEISGSVPGAEASETLELKEGHPITHVTADTNESGDTVIYIGKLTP